MINGQLQKTSNSWKDIGFQNKYVLIDILEYDEFGYGFDKRPVMISPCEGYTEHGEVEWCRYCVPDLNNKILHSDDYGKTWNVRIIKGIVVDGEEVKYEHLWFDEHLFI